METFALAPGMAEQIIAHARSGAPEEVCGIIAGYEGRGLHLYRGQNMARTPRTAFELDVDTLARQIEFADRGLILAAIYHSHPCGPAVPSQTDVAQAFYPTAVQIICSLEQPSQPALRAFRIRGGAVWEVRLLRDLDK